LEDSYKRASVCTQAVPQANTELWAATLESSLFRLFSVH
jgi:hypothetical protein